MISLEQALRNSRFIKDSLKKAGFVANSGKSVWFPTQLLEWLGIQVHTKEGVLSIAPMRIDPLISTLHEILKDNTSVTIRKLASACGKSISMHPVLGSISRLMTRSFYRTIQTSEDNSWYMKVNLSQFPETMGELFFWLENIQAVNIKKLFVQSVPGVLSFSDASDLACGAILSLDNQICHKSWSDDETLESSTWRELKAIHFGLLSFLPFVKNKVIYWFADNQAAAM